MDKWPSDRPRSWGLGSGLSGPNPLRAPVIPNVRYPKSNEMTMGPIELAGALDGQERGAMILPENLYFKNGVAGFPVEFDENAIRGTLLFFERLDYPSNRAIQLGPEAPPGLEDWSGFQRSLVAASGLIDQDSLFERMLVMAYEALDQREPNRWVLARDALTHGFPRNALSEQAAFQLKLINALPLPDRSVPYDEVMMFRDRRAAELQALRHHVEAIGIEVGRHGWGGIAETHAWEKFEASLVDHARVSRETNFVKRLASLEVKFNWTELAKPGTWAGITGTTLSLTNGLPLLVAAIPALQSLGSCVSIESTMGLKKKQASEPTPFEYVFHAHREL